MLCRINLHSIQKFTLINFCIFLLNVTLSAQVSTADSIKFSSQLLVIEQQLMNDIPTGNTDNWSKYLHKNFFIVTEDGSMLNKEDLLKVFAPLPKGYSGYINVTKPKVVFYSNMAVVNYVFDEYENVFESKIHTQYNSMNTYIKTDTSWQMISSQVFEILLAPPVIHVDSIVLKNYTGVYQLSDSIFCTISFSKDSLFYQRTGRNKFALLPETDNIFFRSGDNRGRKLFVKDNEGNCLMKERRNGQDVIWKKTKLL